MERDDNTQLNEDSTQDHDNVIQHNELDRVCHNNRNFLQAIAANAELLLDAQPETQRVLVAEIREAVSCMLAIANDALERSRLAHLSGQAPDADAVVAAFQPKPTSFSLVNKLKMLGSLFAQKAKGLGLEISVVIDDDVLPEVLSYPLIVTETLSNFLSNALKYAPAGSIVTLRAEQASAVAGHGRLQSEGAMRQIKIIVEKHADGYVAYPLGLKGVVVGEGNSYEEALADVKSAIRFHLETFGAEVQPDDSPLLEAFVAEATIPA